MITDRDLVHRLCYIGVELSAQKDVDKLLAFILKESMAITSSDAGSIYFIVAHEGEHKLEFMYTQNNSVDFPFSRFFMPLNTNSIAGASAVTGRIFNFTSMQETVEKLGFKHNTSYDEQAGYHTMNMLVIPLKNYKEEVIGVLQLINKKASNQLLKTNDDYHCIVPYTTQDEEILSALASQVAILIERTELYEAIQETLESMVETLARALDQRDPITAGHSDRVAKYALQLANFIGEKNDTEGFSKEELRELHIAGLLHDVGKIGVPEYLLLKDKKLNAAQFDAIVSRFRYLGLMLHTASSQRSLTQDEEDFLASWKDDLVMLERVNGSGFLPDDLEVRIKDLSELAFFDTLTEETIHVLSPFEYEQLAIKRGNLTTSERDKINSHANNSYALLQNIKWTKDLQRVPEIASQHHEKLNGKGYPLGLKVEALSLASRIMAVADIYDALTAKDRPYKPALSVEKSLAILDEGATKGELDGELVNAFKEMIARQEGN